MKKCTKCGVEKPATTEFFYARKEHTLVTQCKACNSAASHTRYLKNKDIVIKRTRARMAANPDHYRELNTNAARRRRALDGGKKQREYNKKSRESDKDRARIWSKSGYDARRKNPSARINDTVKGRVRKFVQSGESRSQYLPFTPETLKEHLERQFLPGMSWSNFGKGNGMWHIDHIIPLAMFNHDSMHHPDFQAAWALTNLRPLWEVENLKKGANRTHLL